MGEGEGVDDESEEEEDDGALDGLRGEFGAGYAFGQVGFKGENDGDADDEEEGGEDEVGGGHAVPVGMLHEAPRMIAAVVVHHDHEGDGEPAERVEREQAPGGLGDQWFNGA